MPRILDVLTAKQGWRQGWEPEDVVDKWVSAQGFFAHVQSVTAEGTEISETQWGNAKPEVEARVLMRRAWEGRTRW